LALAAVIAQHSPAVRAFVVVLWGASMPEVVAAANRVSELLPKAEEPSKRSWGGTSDAPTWFFRRNPPFAFAQNPTVRVPETPPEPPFRSATQSGGVLVCATSPPKRFPAQQWRRLDRRAYP
jgi:hypothetical protein